MSKIRVAIAGVGNCASSLIQGIYYYSQKTNSVTSGLMHYKLGGYKPQDIEIVAAFDIDERKVGKDAGEAIFSNPNCTKIFHDSIGKINVPVQMAAVLDGVSEHMLGYPPEMTFKVADQAPVDIAQVLRKTNTEILINYLPVGSQLATEYYARACLEAGVAFINNIPVLIASNPWWANEFKMNGIPIIGDDIKSQIGATIVHRILTSLFLDRGINLNRTYQINMGGNTDFLNMQVRHSSKRETKTASLRSLMKEQLSDENLHVGLDYIPWLKDNKVCYIRMEGNQFGDVPINLELRLSVEDSPNSAGVAIDCIRCAKLALDRSIGGPLFSISAYTMKHPPKQISEAVAKEQVEQFINGKLES